MLKTFNKIDGVEIFENVDLSKYSTFKLQSIGNLLLVRKPESLIEIGKIIKKNNFQFDILGLGANQILRLKNKNHIYIKLLFENENKQLDILQAEYNLPASTSLHQLTNAAIKFGLKGWEVFTGIPATLGGAICMNAGTALGEIGNLIKRVQVLRNFEKIEDLELNNLDFRYRSNNFLKENDIILSATIIHFGVDSNIPKKINEYMEYRKNTQPWMSKTCGCVFKNYNNNLKAGMIIDSLGLKGMQIKGLKISEKHANFMENFNNSNSDDFFDLVRQIDLICNRFLGIKFELEVKI